MVEKDVNNSASNNPMTTDDYRLAHCKYGPKLGDWPLEARGAAELFLKTGEGKAARTAEESLDKMLCAAKDEMSMGVGASDFLARLSFIPEQYKQETAADKAITSDGFWVSFGRKLEHAFSPGALLSPAGFVSQGAACAVLLFAGVLVGMNSAQNDGLGTEYIDTDSGYDLTAGLFGGVEDVYSFEE